MISSKDEPEKENCRGLGQLLHHQIQRDKILAMRPFFAPPSLQKLPVDCMMFGPLMWNLFEVLPVVMLLFPLPYLLFPEAKQIVLG